MNIVAYTHVRRMHAPTGVGQHIIHILGGLAQTPGVTLRVMASRRDLGPGGCMPADLPLAHLPTIPLPFSRRVMEGAWERLGFPAADRWCPDADWIYSPAEAFVATRRVRLAVTIHDLHPLEENLPWSASPAHRKLAARWRQMLRPIVKNADLFLAVSEFTRRRIVEILGVREDRIVVVGNGVADSFFDPLPPAAARPALPHDAANAPYALVVGGLTVRKGGDIVLAIAQRLAVAQPDMRILVAGGIDDCYAAQAAAATNIVRLGRPATPELIAIWRRATCLLFVSRYEGFGIPALESMALGVPVIASRTSSLPEVIGDAGILVDPDRPEDAVAALSTVMTDPATRTNLIALGRPRAEASRWSRCVTRLLTALTSR